MPSSSSEGRFDLPADAAALLVDTQTAGRVGGFVEDRVERVGEMRVACRDPGACGGRDRQGVEEGFLHPVGNFEAIHLVDGAVLIADDDVADGQHFAAGLIVSDLVGPDHAPAIGQQHVALSRDDVVARVVSEVIGFDCRGALARADLHVEEAFGEQLGLHRSGQRHRQQESAENANQHGPRRTVGEEARADHRHVRPSSLESSSVKPTPITAGTGHSAADAGPIAPARPKRRASTVTR
jgi:hypothetical protein